MIILKLYLTFFKIGLFSFGGGYAMIPLLSKELNEKNKWCSEEELLDYYAIAQITPGVISVNTATFVGYKLKGFLGALASTLGIISPSIIIISTISNIIEKLNHNYFNYALNGIKIAVVILMLDSVFKLLAKSIKYKFQIIIYILVLLTILIFKIDSVYLIIAAIILGVIINVK